MVLMCRLCGETKHQSQIKCTIDDQSLKIEQKLTVCCRWRLFANHTNLPKNVCQSCFQHLERSWYFAETVAQAQQKLFDDLNNFECPDPESVTVKIEDDVEIDEEMFHDENVSLVTVSELNVWKDTTENLRSSDDQILIKEGPDEYERETDEEIIEISPSALVVELPIPAEQHFELPNKYLKFPQCLSSNDRNPDGTVTNEAIQRLNLVNWSIYQHRCKECDQMFEEQIDLTVHHKKEHANIKMRFHCWLCKSIDPANERSYSDKTHLNRHIIREHIPHLEYCCNLCNTLFWDLKCYKKHRPFRNGCTREGSKKRICEQCGASFTSLSLLRTHQYVKHLPKEKKSIYECFICRCSFDTAIKLRKHMRRLHVQKQYVECYVCHKEVYRMNFTRHMHVHSLTDQHFCSYCGKGFKFSKGVKMHERIHTGERPYKCKVEGCAYSCSDSGNIYTHMKQKHKMVFRKKKETQN